MAPLIETEERPGCCCGTQQAIRGDAASVVYAVLACLAPLVAALSLGFTSPALDTMSGDVKVDGIPQDVPARLVVFSGSGPGSLFSSLINIGALLGSLGGGWVCTYAGRCNTLRIAALLIGGCWIWVAFSSSSLQLCIARLPIGVGVGLQSVAAPMFIAETAPARLRGTLGTLNAAAILFGVMVVDFAGGNGFRSGVKSEICEWRQLALFVSSCAAVLLASSAFLPEPKAGPGMTPQPSIGTSTSEANITSPARLSRRDTGFFQPESQYCKLAFAGLIPMVWQQLSGINAIIFFGQSILASAGIEDYNLVGTSVIGIQLVGILVAAFAIERLGRRPLLLISVGGMALGAASLAVLLHIEKPPAASVIIAMYAYVLFFAVGLGPVPWLLLPELGLPKDLRAAVASFSTAANWGCSFAVTGPPLIAIEKAFGLSGAFTLFSGVCVVGLVLMIFLVPETSEMRTRRHGLERRFSMTSIPRGNLAPQRRMSSLARFFSVSSTSSSS